MEFYCYLELLAMGSDFVYGIINAMDGERDPRILLSLYEFIPTFLITYPLGHLTEDMFEVIACYFPIDFNPSTTDPQAITRDLLADKLANCLCAKEEFAENCVNLLIEKLDSQLNIAKLDSLYLLVSSIICPFNQKLMLIIIVQVQYQINFICSRNALRSSHQKPSTNISQKFGKPSSTNFFPAQVQTSLIPLWTPSKQS